jgi:hypothetical protein
MKTSLMMVCYLLIDYLLPKPARFGIPIKEQLDEHSIRSRRCTITIVSGLTLIGLEINCTCHEMSLNSLKKINSYKTILIGAFHILL